MSQATDPLRKAALQYAGSGQPVFPCGVLGKEPNGKLARHGVKDASARVADVEKWWDRAPRSNIGWPTQVRGSDPWVLDVDTKHGVDGWATVERLNAEHPGDPIPLGGPRATTPSKPPDGLKPGGHIWLRAKDELPVPSKVSFAPGLDTRGQGGYVVVAPSRTDDGDYRGDPPTDPSVVPYAPQWSLDMIRGKAKSGSPATAVRPLAPPADADEIAEQAVRMVAENWKPGNRRLLTQGLAVFFGRDLRLPKDRTEEFVRKIAGAAGDFAPIALDKIADAWKKVGTGERASVQYWLDQAGVPELGDRLFGLIRGAGGTGVAGSSVPESGEFEFRPGQKGRWSRGGLDHVRIVRGADSEDHEEVVPVIAGAVRLLRHVRVEERTYVEVEVSPGERVTLTVPDLLSRLDRDGRTVYHERARDLVPAWFHHLLPETETAFPTWGFYEDAEGRIVEARNPTPVLPEQQAAWEEVKDAVERPASAEDLAAYAKLLAFFHAREILPVFGSAIAAAFAYLLRRRRLLVANPYAWSKRSGLGKTSGAEAVSIGLFRRDATTGGSLNSEFRLPAHLDSYCGPQAVNECERLDWRRLGPDIKASAEGPLATRRGRQDQTMTDYKSREVLLMTSNAAPPLTGTEFVRFLLVHMDESSAAERKARAPEFEACVFDCRSRAIGPALARRIATAYPTVDALVRRRGGLGDEIRTAAAEAGISLGDPRRPGAWANVYLGLEAFACACAEAGVSWTLPQLKTFVRDVVAPVEEGVEEMEIRPIDRFLSFLDSWRVRNTSVLKEGPVVKGEGRVILTGVFELKARDGTPYRVAGTYVTLPVLEEYNLTADRAGRAELRIGSLKELAELGARSVGLDGRVFLELQGGRWKVPQCTFPNGSRPRAAFVPRDQEDFGQAVGGGGGPTLDDNRFGNGGASGGESLTVPDPFPSGNGGEHTGTDGNDFRSHGNARGTVREQNDSLRVYRAPEDSSVPPFPDPGTPGLGGPTMEERRP